MGGAAAVIARARETSAKGNYRWVAQVMNQVVFADPANTERARWRPMRSSSSAILRNPRRGATRTCSVRRSCATACLPAPRRQALDAEMIVAMPAGLVFDYLGTTLNGARAENTKMVLNWRFTDTGESLASTLDHAALTYVAGKTAANAEASITTTRPVFNAIVLRQRTFAEALQRGELTVTGNSARLTELMGLAGRLRSVLSDR